MSQSMSDLWQRGRPFYVHQKHMKSLICETEPSILVVCSSSRTHDDVALVVMWSQQQWGIWLSAFKNLCGAQFIHLVKRWAPRLRGPRDFDARLRRGVVELGLMLEIHYLFGAPE